MRISPLNNAGLSMKFVNLSMGSTSCIHYICLIFSRNKTKPKPPTRVSSNCILFGVCFVTYAIKQSICAFQVPWL